MKVQKCFNNQSGAALVIALIMMIVLTLIGLASSYTSIFEIKLSGNKRGTTDAFYAADSGVQIVMANIDNFDLSKYDVGNKYNYSQDTYNANPTKAEIVINQDTMNQGGPRGFGMGTQQVEFIHFLIESKGHDQFESSLIKSNCQIDQKVVRLIPIQQGGN